MSTTQHFDPEQHDGARPASKRRWKYLIYLLLVSVLLAAAVMLFFELRSAHFQARELSRYAATLTCSLARVPPFTTPVTARSTSARVTPTCL